MSIALIFVLVFGIVATVFGIINKEFRSSTFWFLLAFWTAIVFTPLLGAVHV